MKIALRKQMPHQDGVFQSAHLPCGLLHPANLLKMEESLVLRHIKITEEHRQVRPRVITGGVRLNRTSGREAAANSNQQIPEHPDRYGCNLLSELLTGMPFGRERRHFIRVCRQVPPDLQKPTAFAPGIAADMTDEVSP